jgi:hypothetical protein
MKNAANDMYKRNKVKFMRTAIPRGIEGILDKRKDRYVA